MAQERIDIYTKKGSDAEHEKLQENIDALESKTDSKVEELEAEIATKANDSEVVHLAGAETITGEKTFSSTINGVDIDLSGTATIGGQLELSGSPNLTAGDGVFNFPAQGTESSPATVATTADVADLESSTDTKLESYYTKTETDNLLDEKADASSVYTKTEMDNLLSAKADNTTVSALDTRVSTAETNITSLTSRMTTAEGDITSQGTRITTAEGEIDTLQSEIATKAESADVSALTTRVSSVESTLETKADADDVYTKTETDTLLNAKQDTLTFDTTPTSGSTNPVTSGGVYTALSSKVDTSTLSGYYTSTQVDSLLADKQDTLTFDSTPTSGSTNPITSGGVYTALASKADTSALSDYLTTATASTTYATKEEVEAKQDTLVSGTNIKTINGESLLGSGNIQIEEGGATTTVDTSITADSQNPVTSQAIYEALETKLDTSTASSTYATKTELTTAQSTLQSAIDEKQDTLVSGTNIKTIGGISVLGSGDIPNPEVEVDTEVTKDSQNPVTSAGIYTAIQENIPLTINNAMLTLAQLMALPQGNSVQLDKESGSDYSQHVRVGLGAPASRKYYLFTASGVGDDRIYSIVLPTLNGEVVEGSEVENADGAILLTFTATTSSDSENFWIAHFYWKILSLDGKQDTLVSGTNIRTINGNSILGSGNIQLSGMSRSITTVYFETDSQTQASLVLDDDTIQYEFFTIDGSWGYANLGINNTNTANLIYIYDTSGGDENKYGHVFGYITNSARHDFVYFSNYPARSISTSSNPRTITLVCTTNSTISQDIGICLIEYKEV